MSLDVQVWALGRGGAPDAMLPDLGDYAITPIAGDVGSVSIDYPRDGLRFSALRALIGEDRPVELEIRTDGTSANALGALLYTAKGDDIRLGNVWTFTGYTLEVLMRRARLPYNSNPDLGGNEKGETSFSANAGVVMRTLMQRAQARGTLTDIDFSSFSNTHDSNGVPWTSTAVITLSPGRDYADILATTLHANELCEWEVTRDRRLRLYNPGTRGIDRTLPGPAQLTLEHGRDLEDAPIRHDVTHVITHLTGAGKDGLYTEADNPTALARLGDRVEGYQSFGDVADPGTLAAVTQLAVTAAGDGVSEHTHGLILESEGHPVPGRDFALSDWVLRGVNGATARRRVVRYSLSRKGREVKAAVTLGDLISARAVRVQRQIDALTNGSTVVGTSAPPPDVDDGKAPAAPEGVTGNSTAYYDGGTPLAQISAGWSAVVTNADGTAIGDLDRYEVEFRYTAGQGLPEAWQTAGTTPDTGLDWSPLIQGKGVGVRVRAVDRYARPSAWSTEYLLVTASDAVAPPIPAAPEPRPYLGQLAVAVTGLGSAGEPMPPDFAHFNLWHNTANDFGTAVLYDRLVGGTKATVWTVASPNEYGVEQFFWLTSVDRSGNESGESAAGSAIPQEIGYADIAFNDVGNLVQDGSFERPGSRATHLARSDTGWSMVQAAGADLADHGGWYARGDGSVGTGFRTLVLSGLTPTSPGRTYAYRLAVRGTGVNGDLSARIRWYDKAGVAFQDNLRTFTPAADGTGAWLAREVPEYTAPALAESMRIVIELHDTCTAGTWDVDRVEAREMIGTLLVQNAAITNAKIADLEVGKLTSGELTAIVALLGEMRTADPPNARLVINSTGLRKYDSTDTLRVALTDTETFIDGVLVTGQSDQSRIEVGSGGGSGGRDTLICYDVALNETVALGQLYNAITGNPTANGLLVQEGGDPGPDVLVVYGTVEPGSGLKVGTQIYKPGVGTAVSVQDGEDDYLRMRGTDGSVVYAGPIFSSGSPVGQGILGVDPSGDAVFVAREGALFYQTVRDTDVSRGILDIQDDRVALELQSGSGVSYHGPSHLLRLKTGGFVEVTNNDESAYGTIKALDFQVQSSSATKEAFAALPTAAIDVLRGAPVTQWRYRTEPADAPLRVGPVAEDLPAWATRPAGPAPTRYIRVPAEPSVTDDEDAVTPNIPELREIPADLPHGAGVDLMSMIGLLWDAVRELDEELDEVRRGQGRTPPVRRRVSDLLADIRADRFPRRP